MINKLPLTLTAFAFAAGILGSYAAERDEAEMKQIAASALLSHNGNSQRMGAAAQNSDIQLIVKASDLTCLKSVNGNPFNIYGLASESPGYAIVSTDDSQPALLGYSTETTFHADNVPENMGYYLRLLSRANLSPATRADEETHSSVSPLLGDIAYSQNAPYNDRFPVYNGEHMIAGCGAVAVSQVMAYYKYPQRMTGEKISYTSDAINYVWEWNPEETVFDWDKIQGQHSATAWDTENIPVGASATNMQLREILAYPNDSTYLKMNNFRITESYTSPLLLRLLIVDTSDSVLAYGGSQSQYSGFAVGGWYWLTLPHSVPSSLPDGEYRFAMAVKEGKDATEWRLVTSGESTSPTTIAFTKQGDNYILLGNEYACSVSTSSDENRAVSTLVAACGAAMHTQFSGNNASSSTNTLTYGTVLRNNMSYDDGISLLYLSDYGNDEFENIIRGELDAARPLILSGNSSSYGHAFVCDGYEYKNEIPYYHMNWGWEGYLNGYFLITNKENAPAEDVMDFTSDLSATIGIMPEDGVRSPISLNASSITLSKTEVKEGDYMVAVVSQVRFCTLTNFSGSIRLYAKKDDARYLLGSVDGVTAKIHPYEGSYSVTQLMIPVTIPSSLPDAYYTIELRTVSDDSEEEGYVHVPNTLTLKVGEPEDAIEGISAMTGSVVSPTYSIDGRRLKDASPMGFYIRSGKKYLGR
jgi:hypothetical protein